MGRQARHTRSDQWARAAGRGRGGGSGAWRPREGSGSRRHRSFAAAWSWREGRRLLTGRKASGTSGGPRSSHPSPRWPEAWSPLAGLRPGSCSTSAAPRPPLLPELSQRSRGARLMPAALTSRTGAPSRRADATNTAAAAEPEVKHGWDQRFKRIL